jgi:hypothetical protein
LNLGTTTSVIGHVCVGDIYRRKSWLISSIFSCALNGIVHYQKMIWKWIALFDDLSLKR